MRRWRRGEEKWMVLVRVRLRVGVVSSVDTRMKTSGAREYEGVFPRSRLVQEASGNLRRPRLDVWGSVAKVNESKPNLP